MEWDLNSLRRYFQISLKVTELKSKHVARRNVTNYLLLIRIVLAVCKCHLLTQIHDSVPHIKVMRG
jgi:hypothetical protein